MKNKNRKLILVEIGHLYTRHLTDDASSCFYCNQTREVFDHVPPLDSVSQYGVSFFRKQGIPFVLVPSCQECNSMLSSKPLFTAEKRLLFLEKAYLRKLQKFSVVWDEEEINELGYALRQLVSSRQGRSSFIKKKLEAIQERFLSPETFPQIVDFIEENNPIFYTPLKKPCSAFWPRQVGPAWGCIGAPENV